MTAAELRVALHAALERGAPLPDYDPILKEFARSGTAAEAAEVLETLRVGTSEAIEDRILEILDFVWGWCRPSDRIWPDPQ